jgi:hypothetical protein
VFFILSALVGMVFAAVLGLFAGWEGVMAGLLMGVFLGLLYLARDRLIRHLTGKANKGS